MEWLVLVPCPEKKRNRAGNQSTLESMVRAYCWDERPVVELDCPGYSAQASMSIGAEENQVSFHFNRNLDVSWTRLIWVLTCMYA